MKTIACLIQPKLGLLLVSSILITHAFSQEPSIQWQKSFGGTSYDLHARSIQQTKDGGFITVGATSSTNGDITINHGQYDIWVVKMNSTGGIEWQKTFGGSKSDGGNCMEQTIDGGYIICGTTESNDGDVSNNNGYNDGWVIKLDSSGNIQWQKTVGTSEDDQLYSIHQTADGGYIAAGYTVLYDDPVHYGKEYWVLKFNSVGEVDWQKKFGGSADEIAFSIIQTKNGEYVVTGESASNNGDVTGNHGGDDAWIIKLNSKGELIWQKSLGGTNGDFAYSVQQTNDGGYILVGASGSSDGDLTNNKGDFDYWIVKLNDNGSIKWQKNYGGFYEDEATSVKQVPDGYIISGYSKSFDGDVINNHSSDAHSDYWILKLANNGTIKWQKTLGGSKDDNAWSIATTTDGGYIISGDAESNNGDITRNQGQSDYWIIKLNNSILPVSLINFTAVKNEKAVLLAWQTAQEINSKNFVAERSFDGMYLIPLQL